MENYGFIPASLFYHNRDCGGMQAATETAQSLNFVRTFSKENKDQQSWEIKYIDLFTLTKTYVLKLKYMNDWLNVTNVISNV